MKIEISGRGAHCASGVSGINFEQTPQSAGADSSPFSGAKKASPERRGGTTKS